jgi:hypothetical protein
MSDLLAELLLLERAALKRWCKGDPSGFLELCAKDVVYFDPFLDQRLDGLPALTAYYESLRGKIGVGQCGGNDLQLRVFHRRFARTAMELH